MSRAYSTDVVLFFQYMTSIPQPPEEEKESEEAEENNDEDEKDQKETETVSEKEQEQGSPIVNEVEEMDADGE